MAVKRSGSLSRYQAVARLGAAEIVASEALMTHQWSSRHASRLLGRAAALAVAGQVLVVYAGAASYAEDGLLGDTGPVVPAPAGQAVEQVVPTTPPPALPPAGRLVEPTQHVAVAVEPVTESVQRAPEPVRQAPEPVRQATEQVREIVTEVGQAADQATKPVVRAAEGAGGGPGGSTVPATEAERTTPAVGSRTGSAASPRIAETRPGRAGSVARRAGRDSEVRSRRSRTERAEQAARRAQPADAEPRAAGTTGLPAHEAVDDPNDHSAQQDLAGLTTSLMKLYAGPAVPGGINAGLAGVLGTTTLWTAPLLAGLLTGLWALVLARRCRTDATGTAVTPVPPGR